MKPIEVSRYRIDCPDFVGTALYTGRRKRHEGKEHFEFCDPNPDQHQPETDKPWTEATKLFTPEHISYRPFVGAPMNRGKIRLGGEILWWTQGESRAYGFVSGVLVFVIRKRAQASRFTSPYWLHNLLHDMATEAKDMQGGMKAAGAELAPLAGKKMIPFYWKHEKAFDESPTKQKK